MVPAQKTPKKPNIYIYIYSSWMLQLVAVFFLFCSFVHMAKHRVGLLLWHKSSSKLFGGFFFVNFSRLPTGFYCLGIGGGIFFFILFHSLLNSHPFNVTTSPKKRTRLSKHTAQTSWHQGWAAAWRTRILSNWFFWPKMWYFLLCRVLFYFVFSF